MVKDYLILVKTQGDRKGENLKNENSYYVKYRVDNRQILYFNSASGKIKPLKFTKILEISECELQSADFSAK